MFDQWDTELYSAVTLDQKLRHRVVVLALCDADVETAPAMSHSAQEHSKGRIQAGELRGGASCGAY